MWSYYNLLFNSSLKWIIFHYFDDTHWYLEKPYLNSLFPFTWDRLVNIVFRSGINVFEPLNNLIRAASIDIFGLDASKLRMLSLLGHVAKEK